VAPGDEEEAGVERRQDRVVLHALPIPRQPDPIVREPLARLGLVDRVRLAGYREGVEYDAVLSALDAGFFLVPGSDGSCRAARELVACGLPLIVSRRAPLPEIVADGVSGYVVDERVDALADAWLALVRSATVRREMASEARRRARREFSLDEQVVRVERAYEAVLSLGRRGA
ncbi:MAG: glycosyltransferase, partial [Planctomycetota bacterium JB042]